MSMPNPSYCCQDECCDCLNLRDNLTQLSVNVSGAIVASGTIPKVTPPHSGECVTFSGSLTPTGTCGGMFTFVTVKVFCRTTGKDKWDIGINFGTTAGNCNVMGVSNLPRPDSISCDPFEAVWRYKTHEIIPGFCPCGNNQPITVEVTE